MNKINLQTGRSMIEMLGVLAIIGVLSVGGIMGYSKAMFRYKINKTIEQITYIAGNIRTTFANQGNYAGLTSYCPNNNCIAKKAHIFPEDMWKEGNIHPQSVWEGNVGSFSSYNNKAFAISYRNIPEEACIELITQDWSNAQVKMINAIGVGCGGGCPRDPSFYLLPPVKIDDAVYVCSQTNTSYGMWLDFYFNIDTSDSIWKDYIDATTAALAGS